MSATRFVNAMLATQDTAAANADFSETESFLARAVTDITGAHARPNGISLTHSREMIWKNQEMEFNMYGGVTIAFRPVNNYRSCRMVEVAVEYCSPKDMFNKKVGSTLAVQRFLDGETILVPARNPHNPDELPHTLRDMFGMVR